MTLWQSARSYAPARAALNPVVLLASPAVAAAVPFLLLVSFVPRPLVLPVLSLAAIGCAAVLALAAYWRRVPRHVESITLWDIAGAAALIGFAAGMLTGTDQILYFVDHTSLK
jgi:Cu/Ag efflux pump CusA